MNPYYPIWNLVCAPATFVGSLKVEADGPGVAGDVVFGGSDNLDFAAALALQSQTFLEAVFSQVANVPGFFTGLAFFNPGPGAAELVVEVYAADGTLVGSETLNLPGVPAQVSPGGRVGAGVGWPGGRLSAYSHERWTDRPDAVWGDFGRWLHQALLGGTACCDSVEVREAKGGSSPAELDSYKARLGSEEAKQIGSSPGRRPFRKERGILARL